MQRLSQKIVCVTGGARGIGRAACLRLAEAGASVAVADVRDTDGQRVVDEILSRGGSAQYWRVDVRREQAVRLTFADIFASLGGFDALVTAAAVTAGDRPTHDLGEHEWDEVMATNAKGAFFCAKYALPLMLRRGGGSLVHIASINGGCDSVAAHAAAGALEQMSRADAARYARDHIRVNVIRTGSCDRAPSGGTAADEPHDVASAIVYLVSDESKAVSGTTLVIRENDPDARPPGMEPLP